MTRAHEFLWIDLETTGLLTSARVLEWAVVLAADARGDDLGAVDSFSSVVQCPDVDRIIEEGARKLHERNGLLDEVRSATTTLSESDEFLAGIATQLSPRGGIVLAGASVHFDRRFVDVHLPRFAKQLSHRLFDVSTLKRAVEAWAPEPPTWAPRTQHRALPDILATIEDARIARAVMGWSDAAVAKGAR